MRTTLTLDDDVAALLERVRKERGVTLKQAVNDALRLGLAAQRRDARPRRLHRTASVSLGGSLLPNVDNIAEVLAYGEGENYK